MKEKKLYYSRRFLNKKGHHSTAFVFSEVTKTFCKNTKGKNVSYIDADLKISDCDRVINLSIELNTKRSTNNTLHKLDTLISTLQELKSIILKEQSSQ